MVKKKKDWGIWGYLLFGFLGGIIGSFLGFDGGTIIIILLLLIIIFHLNEKSKK